MTTIYMIRHAEAEGNLYRRCQGHYNSLITDNGYRQIEALAHRFADIPVDAVYSSDLFRTQMTAQAICRPRGLTPYTDPRLREVGTGVWEDTPWGMLDRMDHALLMRFFTADESWSVPGSETYPGARVRMCAAMNEIAARHDGGTAAVFSHGSAIQVFVSTCMGLPITGIPLGDNTSVSKLTYENGTFTAVFHGDNAHLSEEISTAARQRRMQAGGRRMPELWFRPLDLAAEADTYLAARQEAWLAIHKTMEHYDGEKFLRDARAHSADNPQAVLAAMRGDQLAGILQMDLRRDAEQGIGGIPFCYMTPEFRCRKLGVQLLGQAVSTYRGLGRTRLRLRCAPDNVPAQHFYRKYGFVKTGMAQDSAVPLELLDKYIGFDPAMYADRLRF